MPPLTSSSLHFQQDANKRCRDDEQSNCWKGKQLVPCLIDGELGGSTAPHNGQDIAAKQHLHNADAAILKLPPKLQHGTVSGCAPASASVRIAACHSVMLWAVHHCQQTEAEHHYCMRGQLTVSLNGSQLYTLKPAERSMSQLQQVERACLCTRL